MYDFHNDRKVYFDMQADNCKEYVLPFIEETIQMQPNMRVMEIGCGEAGVLKPFLEKGCICVGVELDAPRLITAQQYLPIYVENKSLQLISKDIYKVDVQNELGGKFDVIILKDVIEHIHDQAKLIAKLKDLINPNGCIFFGFPPWQMPFGGHQQLCKSKICKTMPYYHLLPNSLYKWILNRFNEPTDELLEIKETGISIERFEKIIKNTGLKVVNKTHYLINPIYKYKFGINAKKQFPILKNIPWIRNFYTTCVFYTISN